MKVKGRFAVLFYVSIYLRQVLGCRERGGEAEKMCALPLRLYAYCRVVYMRLVYRTVYDSRYAAAYRERPYGMYIP